MITFPKPYSDRVAKLRVPGGFVLVAAFAWFSRPTPASLLFGLPISILGLALRAWAAGHLAKNLQLTTSGPYAFLRNPLYIGTLFVATGLVLSSRSAVLGVVFASVFLLIYLPVIQLEEQHLRSLFPEFSSYAAAVPALAPKWPRDKGSRRFQFALYRKNREYQAGLGFAAGAILLFWKAVL